MIYRRVLPVFLFLCAVGAAWAVSTNARADEDEEPQIHAEFKSIDPATAYVGESTRVKIYGAHFSKPIHVWIGHAPCSDTRVNHDETEIQCVTAPHPSGTVDLVLKTSAGVLVRKGVLSFIPKFKPIPKIKRVEDLVLEPEHHLLRQGTKKTFTATGGTPPYHFTIMQGGSKIDENSGELTAGQGPDWGVIQVADSEGQKRVASYYVPEKLRGTPESLEVLTDGVVVPAATGGVPPYTMRLIQGAGKFYPDVRGYLAPNMPEKAMVRVSDTNGDEAKIQITVHYPPAPPPRIIAAGEGFSCAALSGNLSCWGAALGDPHRKSTSLATPVESLKAGVDSVVAGLHHACVLSHGGVKCWGDNRYGQLGDGTTTSRPEPVDVVGLDSGVLAIAAGDFHTCAVLNNTAVCWGRNDDGQLGDGTLEATSLPTQVSGLEGQIDGISGGAFHTCAIVNGIAKCWGKNENGQLGTGNLVDQLTPTEVTALGSGVQSISAGRAHTCAVQSGQLKCWGFNGIGNLGLNNAENKNKPFEVPLLGATVLATRQYHTCAVSALGLYCWGYNYQGQIGDSSYVNRFAPTQVQGLPPDPKDVATGNSHTCAILGSGQIYCWGENYFGQLGNGFNTQQLAPVQVKFKVSEHSRKQH